MSPSRDQHAVSAGLLEPISGVIDGTVVTSIGTDGDLSFHVSIGEDNLTRQAIRIELVLNRDHAQRLGQALTAGDPEAGDPEAGAEHWPEPCFVGILLR